MDAGYQGLQTFAPTFGGSGSGIEFVTGPIELKRRREQLSVILCHFIGFEFVHHVFLVFFFFAGLQVAGILVGCTRGRSLMLGRRRNGSGYGSRSTAQAEVDPKGPRQRDRTSANVVQGEQHEQSAGSWSRLKRELEVEKERLKRLRKRAEKELEVEKESLRKKLEVEKERLRRIVEKELEVEKERLRKIAEKELEVEKERLRKEEEELRNERRREDDRIMSQFREEQTQLMKLIAEVLTAEAKKRSDGKKVDTAVTVVEEEIDLVRLDTGDPKTEKYREVEISSVKQVVDDPPLAGQELVGTECRDLPIEGPSLDDLAFLGQKSGGTKNSVDCRFPEGKCRGSRCQSEVDMLDDLYQMRSGSEVESNEIEVEKMDRVAREGGPLVNRQMPVSLVSNRVAREGGPLVNRQMPVSLVSNRVAREGGPLVNRQMPVSLVSNRVAREGGPLVTRQMPVSVVSTDFTVKTAESSTDIVSGESLDTLSDCDLPVVEVQSGPNEKLEAECRGTMELDSVFPREENLLDPKENGEVECCDTGEEDTVDILLEATEQLTNTLVAVMPRATEQITSGPVTDTPRVSEQLTGEVVEVKPCVLEVMSVKPGMPVAPGRVQRVMPKYVLQSIASGSEEEPNLEEEIEQNKKPIVKAVVVSDYANEIETVDELGIVAEAVKKESEGTSEAVSVGSAGILVPHSGVVAVPREQNKVAAGRQQVGLRPIRASDVLLRAYALEQARFDRVAKAKKETSRRERNIRQKWQGKPETPIMASKESSGSKPSSRQGQTVMGKEKIELDCLGAREEEVVMEDFSIVLDRLGAREEEVVVKDLGIERDAYVVELNDENTVMGETVNVREIVHMLESETVTKASLETLVEQELLAEEVKLNEWKQRKRKRRSQKWTIVTQVELGLVEQPVKKEKNKKIAVPGCGTEQLNIARKQEKQNPIMATESVDRESVDSSRVEDECVDSSLVEDKRKKLKVQAIEGIAEGKGIQGEPIAEGFVRELMVVFEKKLSIMKDTNETEIARNAVVPTLEGREVFEKVFFSEQPAEELQDKCEITHRLQKRTETDSEVSWVLARSAANVTAVAEPSLVKEEVDCTKKKALVLKRKKVEVFGKLEVLVHDNSVTANGVAGREDGDLEVSSHLCVSFIMLCYLLFLLGKIVVSVIFGTLLRTHVEKDRFGEAEMAEETESSNVREPNYGEASWLFKRWRFTEAGRTVLARRKDRAREAARTVVARRKDRARNAGRTVLDRRKDKARKVGGETDHKTLTLTTVLSRRLKEWTVKLMDLTTVYLLLETGSTAEDRHGLSKRQGVKLGKRKKERDEFKQTSLVKTCKLVRTPVISQFGGDVGTRPHLMSRMSQGCCKDRQEVTKTRNMNRRTGRAIAGRARTDITLYGQCVDQIISSNRIEFCVMVMGPGSQYLSWSLAWLKLVTSCLRYSELH